MDGCTDGVNRIHSSAHGWMHGGTDEVMWVLSIICYQLLVYRVPPWSVLHYYYYYLLLSLYVLLCSLQ